jgi:hypothetical protein
MLMILSRVIRHTNPSPPLPFPFHEKSSRMDLRIFRVHISYSNPRGKQHLLWIDRTRPFIPDISVYSHRG